MRRPHPTRPSQPRKQLGFEPLEPREMLFADAGIDWWSSWDAGAADDWSWTFDDTWASDAAGDSWWSDGWWVGDAGANDPGFPADDAGGYDPAADFVDAGVDTSPAADTTTDVMPDSGPDVGEIAPDLLPAPAVDAVIPPLPPPPSAVQEVVVVAPVEQDIGPPPHDAGTVDAPAGAFDDPAVEIPVTDLPIIDVPFTDLPDLDGQGDSLPQADNPPSDVTTDEAVSAAIGIDIDGPVTNDSSPSDTTPSDGVDSASPTDEPEADDGVDEPVVVPTVVVLPSVANGPASLGATPAAGIQPVTNAPGATAFGAWGAFFFQSFGRQADAADPTSTSGQPGTGRPRIRLPFRPFA